MKTTTALLILLTAGLHADEASYWRKRRMAYIEESRAHSERIERDWQHRQAMEQRERLHREQVARQEKIRKEIERVRISQEHDRFQFRSSLWNPRISR